MTNKETTAEKPASKWRSVRMTETAHGYRVREDGRQFRAEVCTEIAFRFVGMSSLVAGAATWGIAPQTMVGLWPTMTISVLFALTGMILFMMSRRGFRREMHADLKRREFRLCKLNARGRALVTQSLPMTQVQSLYVRRSEGGDTAALVLRLPGGRKLTAMRGREEELTALHRMLCRDINEAERTVAYARPVHPTVRRPKAARSARPSALIPA